MKYRKLRFLSVVCIASLIISQGAIAANSVNNGDPGSTSGYSQTDVTPISVDDLKIKVEKKEYNGNTTANATVTVKPDLLNGKNVTVKYTAAAFDNENAGENKAVTISGLHLEGEDKDAFRLDVEEKTVNDGVITQRIVELTPNDTQAHYTNEKFPVSVDVNYVKDQIVSGDEVDDIPSNIFIVKSGNAYFYSLEENKVVDGKDSTNKNYRFKIDESIKPDVNEPEPKPAELLPAEIVSPKNITYDDELGFITKDNVSIVLRAQPGMPDNGLSFYLTSDKEDENKTYTAIKDNNEYKSNAAISLPTDDGTVRTVEIKCSLVEGTEPSTPIQFSNGTVDSYKLMIDKAAPSINSVDNKLTLTYNDSIQKIGVSGGFSDNDGTGIKSIEYKFGNKEYQPIEISGNGNKINSFDFKTGEQDIYYIADYKDFDAKNIKDGTCQITFKVTDNVGNELITNNESFNKVKKGGTIAKPVITSIALKSGKETELDKFLNILSFGIYSNNKELTLKIEAAPADFDVKDKNVTVSLLHKNDEGKLVVFNDLEQTKEVGKGTVFTFSLANEAVADQLSVKIENKYGKVLTQKLREALKTNPKDNPQWNDNTTKTDSDKWVFDKTPPQISLSLDSRFTQEEKEEGFEARSIRKDFGKFEISADDKSSGISLFEVYNINENTYTISDKNEKEFVIADDKGKKYSIIKLIENGFIISDGENTIEVSIKKETITVDNPDVPDNPNTKDTYSIVDKNNSLFFFADEDSEYTLEAVNGEKNYVIKNDDISTNIVIDEVHNLYKVYSQNNQIVDLSKENVNVHCVIFSDTLSKGENTFVVHTIDNAGNESNENYIVEVLEEPGKTTLALTEPIPDEKMLEEKQEYWINESTISDTKEFPLSLKMSLSSSDITQIQSINYFLIKDDKDADCLEEIESWNVVNKPYKSNIDNKIKNDEQLLQLTQEDYEKIKNTNNFNNNIIHIKANITYKDKTEQDNDIVIHVDKKAPEIGTFKVEKTNDSVEDIIHILTFGIFCNNQVKISTDVTDAVNDVGIDSVSFISVYDNNEKELTTENDGNGYYIILPGDTQIYQTGIKVVATDKLGNETTEYLNKGNLVIDESNDYKDLENNLILIEEYAPVPTITMPTPTYGSNGDSWFDGADKEISLKVTDDLFGVNNNSGIRDISVKVNEKSVGTAESGSYKTITSDGEVIKENGTLITSSISEKSKIVEADYTFSIYDLIDFADTNDGSYELVVKVVDNAGNVSTESATFYRDIEPPEVTGIVFSPADSNGRTDTSVTDDNYKLIDQNQGIKKMDYGYYFQSGFTLKINAKDRSASSGLKKATVTLMEYNDDGTYSENEIKTVNFNTGTKSGTDVEVEGESYSVKIDSGFKGMILAEVTDNTGNVSGKRSPRAFVSDNKSPTIEIHKENQPLGVKGSDNEYLKGSNNEYLYTENAKFTVTITDEKSGLKSIGYSTASDTDRYISVNGSLNADDLDNKFIDGTNRRYNIVKGADNPEIGDTGWKVTKTDLNVVTQIQKTFTYGDIVDTINQYQDGKVHYLDDKNIVLSIKVFDNSNNEATKSTDKFTIDRVNPEINKVSLISSDGTKEVQFTDDNPFEYKYFYNEPFSFTVKAEDKSPSSGLNNVGYKFINYSFDNEGKEISKEIPGGNVSVATGETEPIQSPEEFKKGQISVQAVDNTLVNKSKTKKTHGIVIDNTAPEITISDMPETNSENNAVDDGNNLLYNDPKKVSFTVTVEDTESGIQNIHYSKTSEKTYGTLDVDTNINTSDYSYKVKSSVGSAENDSDWKIEAMDHNLVTRVSRVFTFNEDDKNIQFSFKATDRSENNSDTKTSQSFTIDTAAPSVTGIKFSIKTADNISEVKPEEFIEELEYGYYFKEQMVITASCEDSRPSSGLKMLSFRFVPYKDGEKIEQSQYAEPKKFDVDKESIKVNQKVVNGKASCTVEKGFKGQIFVTAYDYAAFYYDENASKEITSKAFVIEDNAPNIKIDELPETSLTDDLGNKLYTDKVSFKVTITDTESGLRELSYAKRSDNIEDDKTAKETVSQKIVNNSKDYKVGYKFKNTKWVIERMDNNLVTEVSQTFVFDKDDKNIYMIFGATDRSNNKATDKNREKFTIDTVNPTVEKFNFEPASEDNISEVTDFIEELEYGYYFKKSFNAVVTVDDKIPSSGLDKVVFRLVAYENGEYVSEESYSVAVRDKKANYLIPEGFKGQIYAKVYDRAVNESFEETPQAFVVDEIAPVITIEPLPDNNDKTDMDGNKLYAHSVQFKVTVSDTKSGLRNIFYSKSSEKNSFDDVSTQIQNVTQYKEGDEIPNGWLITKMDNNLVTEVTQVFTFNDDDNHIVMNYRAIDRSMNSSENVKSESFTIDTTAPVVRVSYPDLVNDMYYKESVTFTFSITERNFDSSLMERTIKDSFRSNNDLQISYNSSSITEHTATVTFPEGDYEFAYSGEDRGGNKAQFFEEKSTSGFSSFNKSFYVDTTNPKIVSADFYGDGEDNLFKKDYYNKDSIPHIKVTIEEHNVSKNSISSYIKLGFKTASSGEAHNVQNLSETDWDYISNEDWKSLGNDRFSIDIDFNNKKYPDGVYQIIMELTDPAENKGESVQSKIFELDRVVPVLSQRNGEKNFVVSPFVDVYDEKRKEDKAPSLTFDDKNFEKLVIKADIFKTKYIEDNQIISMEKDVLSDELSKTYNNKKFSLDKYFDDDGVYVFTFVAYDKAGNASKEINDTYFKMVKTDCLAYIANSDAEKHTGYYSLMDNNQRAISKKATDFSDLDITIVTKNDDDNSYSIEIKDNKDQQQRFADAFVTLNSSKIGNSETAVMKEMHLPGSYFSENFKDDSLDARMDLSVLKKPADSGKEKDQSTDTKKTTPANTGEEKDQSEDTKKATSYYLAKIHIDNEKPSATLPEFFHSWSNVMFTDNVEVTLTNISEKLDMSKTKIYECPREGDRVEIQLTDSNYDESKKKLTFTLSEGIHNIDISLVDEAGNEWNVDRIRYFTVGNLWLYVGIGVVLGIVAIVVTIIIFRKNKKFKKKTVQST